MLSKKLLLPLSCPLYLLTSAKYTLYILLCKRRKLSKGRRNRMKMIEAFTLAIRKYKKRIKPYLPIYPNGLDTLYEYFGIESDGSYYSLDRVIVELRQQIKDILQVAGYERCKSELTKLQRHYFYQYKKNHIDVQEPLNVLERVSYSISELDRLAKRKYRDLNKQEIVKLLKLTVFNYALQGEGPDEIEEYYQRLYPKEWRYTENILELEQLVPRCVIEDGELKNMDDVSQYIFHAIEENVIKYGAFRFLSAVYLLYMEAYDEDSRLFTTNSTSRKFLYHTAIKHATIHSTSSPGEGDTSRLQTINRLTNALVNLFDYRIDSQFEFVFFQGDPIQYLHKVIFHDALFKDKQYDPESILVLLENILLPYENEIISKIGVNVNEFICISRAIIQYATQQLRLKKKPNFRIKPADILSKKILPQNIDKLKVKLYFQNMITDSPVNSQYKHPMDMSSINDDSMWLIQIPGSTQIECFLPLPSVACPGLYDKILEKIGYPNIGIEYEEFIRSWFVTNSRLHVHTGKYILNNKVFESDGVVMNGNDIFLLECKTKPLRRDSRSGHIGKLLIDLSRSYLKSTLQVYRCEAAFRSGELVLYDKENGDKDILNGKGNQIAILKLPENPTFWRISCTTLGFGTLSENIVSKGILKAICYYDYKVDDPSLHSSIVEMHKDRDALLKVWDSMGDYYKRDNGEYFHNITHRTLLIPFALMYNLTKGMAEAPDPFSKVKMITHMQLSNYDTPQGLRYLFGLSGTM